MYFYCLLIFRELPNPLCTFQLYTCFVLAVKLTNAEDGSEIRRLDDSEKLIRMRETVVKLPPPHYRYVSLKRKVFSFTFCIHQMIDYCHSIFKQNISLSNETSS